MPLSRTRRGGTIFRKEGYLEMLKGVLAAFVLLVSSVPAMADECEAQYTQTQCEQLGGLYELPDLLLSAGCVCRFELLRDQHDV